MKDGTPQPMMSLPLVKVLGDEKDDDPDYPTYIWLIWLSEDDFMGFVDEKDMIGLVYENEVETKRQSYEHYHNLNVDPDTLVRDC